MTPSARCAVALLAVAPALVTCSPLPDVCGDTPPSASEYRASCSKNGVPDDCGEALDLCRSTHESLADYCRRICSGSGIPHETGCLFTGKCTLMVKFARLECSFCSSL